MFRSLSIESFENSIDIDIINEFELSEGYILPASYKQLISQYNEVSFNENCFEVYDGNITTNKYILRFCGFNTNFFNIKDYQKKVRDKSDFGLENIIAFAITGNESVLCFDYREDLESNNPKVLFVNLNEYEKYNNVTFKEHFWVADTFDDFVKKIFLNKFLHIPIEYDNGTNNIDTIETFEEIVKYTLPPLYKKLLLQHDEIRTQMNTFDFLNYKNNKTYSDIYFYGLKLKTLITENFDYFSYSELVKAQKNIENSNYYGVKGMVAIGDSALGDIICLYYNKKAEESEPSVVLLIHDDFIEDAKGIVSMKIEYISENFSDFLNILYKSKD